jgi:hypothetical protein
MRQQARAGRRLAQRLLGDPVGQQLPDGAGVGDVVPHRRERPLGEFLLGASSRRRFAHAGSLLRQQRPWTSRVTRRRTLVTASLESLTRWK